MKQNISLKIEVQQRGLEMKKYKKLVLELERELERMQKTKSRERELEERLEEMEVELRELRRKKGSSVGGSISAKNKVMADQELLERNAQLEQREQELEENLEVMKGLLEENSIMIQDLREQLERKGTVHDKLSKVGDALGILQSLGEALSDVSYRRLSNNWLAYWSIM